MAVPVRPGTRFAPPPHYAAWEAEYADTTAVLKAEGKTANLANVLGRFKANGKVAADAG